jgi:alkylation response protein AidB-like acyl-CoA dehydrogenase
MTEKQGGSDVRANTTRAYPVGGKGPGQAYELVGHKYFVSAPMSDAFLVLAQAAGGLSCFLLPRWRPDGSKNPLQLLRLKRKMGNVSNASSETELRGALAWMVGEVGRDDALRLHGWLIGRSARRGLAGAAPLLDPFGFRTGAEPAAVDAQCARRPGSRERRRARPEHARCPGTRPP